LKPVLTITISDQGLQQEREYSIRMLLTEFLGLKYELAHHSKPTYILQSGDGKITMEDVFFSRFVAPDAYLKEEHIQKRVSWLDIKDWEIQQLPVLFGDNTIQLEGEQITCGADLFASAFFMLSRWEEYANPIRDAHDRFPGNESLAYRQGFLNRPVVNEYANLLWQMLQQIGYTGQRKNRQFKIVPTHDIDDLQFWTPTNKKRRFLNLAGDMVKRGNFNMARQRWKSYAATQKDPAKDPYYTYDHLMNKAEKAGVQARFYFMAGGETAYDRPYDLGSTLFKEIVNNIKHRGHTLGFHASYDTYRTPGLFKEEKRRLEQAIDMEVTAGRQHYLRFENPLTSQILENAALQTDSTLYYSDYPGFRCGCCYTFPLFDILNKRQTEVLEQPLLVMDGCLEVMDTEKAIDTIHAMKEQVKKHQGDFVFLVHNSSYGWMNSNPDLIAIEKVLYEQ